LRDFTQAQGRKIARLTFPSNDKSCFETPQQNMADKYKILEITCYPDLQALFIYGLISDAI
jgi:hypothetical protein